MYRESIEQIRQIVQKEAITEKIEKKQLDQSKQVIMITGRTGKRRIEVKLDTKIRGDR